MNANNDLLYYLFLLFLLSLVVLFYIYYESHRRQKENLTRGRIVGFWNGSERRRFKRLKSTLEVKYEISNNTKPFKKITSRDISQGGLGLVIYEKLREGTPLRIWVNLPENKEAMFLLGDIVWLREISKENIGRRVFSAGVKFTAVDTATQVKLFDFINELEKQEEIEKYSR